MSTKKNVIIGCAVAAVAFVVVAVVVAGGCIAYFAQDPKGVAIELSGGTEARKGEEFELVVKVTNERNRKSFKLTDIDINDSYLDGFVVVGTVPGHKSSSHVPVSNSQSFTFDVSIPAKESREFRFKLRPVSQGVFKGDLDVYEGLRCITTSAQTEVK